MLIIVLNGKNRGRLNFGSGDQELVFGIGGDGRWCDFSGRGAGQVLLEFFDGSRESSELPDDRKFERSEFGLNVLLVIWQFGGEINHLACEHVSGCSGSGEDEQDDEQHRTDPAEPSLKNAHDWREQKCKQSSERDGDQDVPTKIEGGDDERGQQHRPDTDQRFCGCGAAFEFRRGVRGAL